MPQIEPSSHPTACLALADGTLFYGKGFGATGQTTAELCFNTAMTGYQEIMTDPSYAGQVVTFTFPHVGNVGINPEDDEAADPVAEGLVVKWDPTEPSNWRAAERLTDWLTRRGRIGIGGIDTRRLTRAIRQQGAPHVALAHDPDGLFDIEALVAAARGFRGLEGLDLAKDVTCASLISGTKCDGPGRMDLVAATPPATRSLPSTTAPREISCAALPRQGVT